MTEEQVHYFPKYSRICKIFDGHQLFVILGKVIVLIRRGENRADPCWLIDCSIFFKIEGFEDSNGFAYWCLFGFLFCG